MLANRGKIIRKLFLFHTMPPIKKAGTPREIPPEESRRPGKLEKLEGSVSESPATWDPRKLSVAITGNQESRKRKTEIHTIKLHSLHDVSLRFFRQMEAKLKWATSRFRPFCSDLKNWLLSLRSNSKYTVGECAEASNHRKGMLGSIPHSENLSPPEGWTIRAKIRKRGRSGRTMS